VSGTGFSKLAADDANAVLTAAGTAGVKVTGTVAAPAAPDAAALQTGLADLLGRSGINFASGSAEITAESASILDTASQSILQLPGVKIEIGGHTDNVGSAASNQSLSDRRANAVLNYIVGKGVPADQLTAVGFGDTQPIVPNDTDEGRAQNRRIEFKVQGS
jgi:OmpA-OmpF porin, OOP family